MFAVIVNTIAIVLSVFIGLLLKKGLPKSLGESLMKGLGLCVIIIGIKGALETSNVLIMIISIAAGLAIGEGMDLDSKVNNGTQKLISKFSRSKNNKIEKDYSDLQSISQKLTEAFVTSCLIMNVGAMVIVGSLDAGLKEDFSMLYTKSTLDFISGIMLTAAMGVGVMGSALFTLVFQGAVVLCATIISPYMSDILISELSVTGSVLIFAIGTNMIGITEFKVINYLPALIIVPFALKLVQILHL